MYDSLPLDEIVVSERISLFKSVILELCYYVHSCILAVHVLWLALYIFTYIFTCYFCLATKFHQLYMCNIYFTLKLYILKYKQV